MPSTAVIRVFPTAAAERAKREAGAAVAMAADPMDAFGILADGKLQALGTALELKRQWGVGSCIDPLRCVDV